MIKNVLLSAFYYFSGACGLGLAIGGVHLSGVALTLQTLERADRIKSHVEQVEPEKEEEQVETKQEVRLTPATYAQPVRVEHRDEWR